MQLDIYYDDYNKMPESVFCFYIFRLQKNTTYGIIFKEHALFVIEVLHKESSAIIMPKLVRNLNVIARRE